MLSAVPLKFPPGVGVRDRRVVYTGSHTGHPVSSFIPTKMKMSIPLF